MHLLNTTAPWLTRGIAPLIFAGVVVMSGPGIAFAGPYDTDRAGGKDHPMITRYQGSMLYMYGESSASTTQILRDEKGKPVMRPLEGRISNRLYWGPKGASPLEVFRNYQHALTAAGFETLFACEAQQCLTLNVQPMLSDLPRTADWIDGDAMVDSTFNSGNQPGFHYISARKTVPGGVVHVQIALAGGSEDPPVSGRVRQMVQIVEPAKIELGKVTVDAKTIQEGLQRDGKIALYGVLFDTNKAVLRPESAPQLAEMAQVLKADPALEAFVVGHTDNEGDFGANMGLSQKRAAAVVAELSGRYGIPAARLTAQGVANLAPVATNSSAEGRASNRRVELVVR